MDIFNKIKVNKGPLGKYFDVTQEYFMFPKLEGELSPKMKFKGKTILNWSINNYLGLGNHPEVRRVDAQAAKTYGLAYPMGSRMMSGNSDEHDKLENNLAKFIKKDKVLLLNYGYQGIFSAIQAICSRKDVIVYDANCHACILDGMQLHHGKRFVYKHNEMVALEQQLIRAKNIIEKTKGGILVITEGVFGMSGTVGNLKEITDLKAKYKFRLLVDDAHGFGTMGETGMGTGEQQGVQDKIDLYFSTFAKSMASIGAFIGGEVDIINYLKCNMRSQIFAKSLPLPIVLGTQKRLDIIINEPEHKKNLWTIAKALQEGLVKEGFNIGNTQAPVTPVYLNGSLDDAIGITYDLRENHRIFCSIVAYPVIPKGEMLIRLIPTAAHTLEHVKDTINSFKEVKIKLKRGNYADSYSDYEQKRKKNQK